MATRDYDVTPMEAGERSAVIGMLTRAFYDDPLFGFFVPDAVSQTKGLIAFMGAAVIDAIPFGDVWVARRNGKIACAAGWLPPHAYPRGPRRDVLTTMRGIPTFVRSGRRIAAAVRLQAAVDKAHHALHEPHYYLALLGTDPLYQRSGAGSAALAPVLAKCDEQGVPAYLETQKEENLAYYTRHAFDLEQKIDVRGAPPIWTLIRTPR